VVRGLLGFWHEGRFDNEPAVHPISVRSTCLKL
jgi:hypothetical protein